MSVSGSEESFRFVADIVPVLIWMSDADKRCTYVNASWTAFTGRSLEAVVRDGWRDSIHPDDLPRCLEVMTAKFERREPFTAEYRLKRRDGEYRWVLEPPPRFAPDGALTGSGSSVDIGGQTGGRVIAPEGVGAHRSAAARAIGSWQ